MGVFILSNFWLDNILKICEILNLFYGKGLDDFFIMVKLNAISKNNVFNPWTFTHWTSFLIKTVWPVARQIWGRWKSFKFLSTGKRQCFFLCCQLFLSCKVVYISIKMTKTACTAFINDSDRPISSVKNFKFMPTWFPAQKIIEIILTAFLFFIAANKNFLSLKTKSIKTLTFNQGIIFSTVGQIFSV